MSLAKLTIKRLEVAAHIGVTEEERSAQQPLFITIGMWVEIDKAAATDSIDETVNYKTVSVKLAELVEPMQVNLLETLAVSIADTVLSDKNVKKVEVTIEKPQALKKTEGAVIEFIKTNE